METNSNGKSYPIATAISCYKESRLVQGAIRSVSMLSGDIWVWEGRCNPESFDAEPTQLGTAENTKIHWGYGEWDTEAAKRTAIIQSIKEFYPEGCWILTLDADEIFIHGEFLQDWVDVLDPGYPEADENIVPIVRTDLLADSQLGWITTLSPGRLIHSSCIDHYKTASVIFATPTGEVGIFSHERVFRIPHPGEPHIHHRHYLRKPERAKYRQLDVEQIELQELNTELRLKREADRLARGIRTKKG